MEFTIWYKHQPVNVLIDDNDFELVNQYVWHQTKARNTSYAMYKANAHTKPLYMHRLIMNAPDGIEVDHVDRNGLNNQRDNLRLVSHRDNLINTGMFANNTTGYRGVIAFGCGYRAQIKYHGILIHSRIIRDITKTALIRDELALRCMGAGAYQNLPNTQHSPEVVQEVTRLMKERRF